MKALALIMITGLLLLAIAGCNQADSAQGVAPNSPEETNATDAVAGPSAESAGANKNSSYDDVFADINDAVFTTREANALEENGNYFRINRIDVVDENGFDHQGIVVVCEGAEAFTQAYQDYVDQVLEIYGADLGVIAGYRNAATKGNRTYRDADIAFFCMQDVMYTDRDGIERRAVVIALDGTDEYVAQEALLYSAFRDAYWQTR